VIARERDPATAGHPAVPVEDSWYEEKTTLPANLKAVSGYPVIAVCSRCHQRIRRPEREQGWQHVPVEAPGDP